MADQTEFEFVASISALSDEHRLRFYETLAHNLTISIRAVWNDNARSDAQKVNEILHRVTSKIAVIRRHLHKWTEADMWDENQKVGR